MASTFRLRPGMQLGTLGKTTAKDVLLDTLLERKKPYQKAKALVTAVPDEIAEKIFYLVAAKDISVTNREAYLRARELLTANAIEPNVETASPIINELSRDSHSIRWPVSPALAQIYGARAWQAPVDITESIGL